MELNFYIKVLTQFLSGILRSSSRAMEESGTSLSRYEKMEYDKGRKKSRSFEWH